ncbi:MAG: PrsW family intramembrane metalloprotease [Labilithrix sp.]|nr:PrsW family intramembrane metalloprotease [Labilithrix sp.]
MSRRARALVVFLALVLFALSSTACAGRIVGTQDVELTYEADDPAFGGASPYGRDLRAMVLRRFMADSIGADVTQEGKRLRIVVDEALAAWVDELVTWPGSVLVLETDPMFAGAPRDEAGLVAKTETLEDGRVSRYWEGSRVDVTRALDQWIVDRDHRVVAEPMWATAGGATAPRYRTRVVWSRPLGELYEGVHVGWGEGGTLRLRAEKGTPADEVVTAARERQTARPGAARAEILVRGRTSLGHPSWSTDSAYVTFGAGIEAYARAQDEKQLLVSGRLPILRRVDAVGLPPNTGLATACFVVPVLLSLAWLVFVRRFDRAHPEPMWLVLTTFVLGALSTIPAGIAELALATATPWLDPRVVTFGGQLFAFPLAVVVFTIVVGLSEEGAKMLGATFAMRRPEFDEPVDGIVYGIVSSLGFAAAENIRYFAMTRLAAPIVVARCFMSVPAHMFFGAIWGYALGARLVEKRPRVLLFLLLAALGHGLFDALLSTDGGGVLAIFLNVALASVFVSLVRRSLRHGVVDDAVRRVRPDERKLFRVGRPGLFFLSSLALHVLAFGIVVLGGWYQLARHRPNATFVVGSSVMLALLAVAAFGISATLPLDVVVDGYGVTFGGAARSWSRIRRFEVKGDHVVLDCEGGPILLGPGSPDVIESLVAALREHVGTRVGERTATLESVAARD